MWSILVTLFCCLPLGIVAIITSPEVNSTWAAGDYAGAQQSADAATTWITWSLFAGVINLVLSLIAFLLFGAFACSASTTTY